MKTRLLGHGLEVSALGLGCMGMSDFYGQHDDAQSLDTLDRALELGITLFDTADMYGPYTNEELLGRALAGRRERVVLATKFGIVRGPNPTDRSINGRPDYVFTACEGSLKRLRVDTIDLYYLHRRDPNTPIEDTVGAMAELVAQGKVRYIGLSEVSEETLRRAHVVHPISALQSEYSLWSREPEDGILQACRELGIGFVAYSPLGRGFLSGKIKSPDQLEDGDFRKASPRFAGDNFEANLDIVRVLEALSREKGVAASQLALAWVLARGDDVVPIPGTKRRQYLEENVGALDVHLSAEDLARIETVLPKGRAAGDRYAPVGMRSVGL